MLLDVFLSFAFILLSWLIFMTQGPSHVLLAHTRTMPERFIFDYTMALLFTFTALVSSFRFYDPMTRTIFMRLGLSTNLAIVPIYVQTLAVGGWDFLFAISRLFNREIDEYFNASGKRIIFYTKYACLVVMLASLIPSCYYLWLKITSRSHIKHDYYKLKTKQRDRLLIP